MSLIGLTIIIAGGMLSCTNAVGDTHEILKLLSLAVGGCVLWSQILKRQRGILPATPLDIPIMLFWASVILSTFFSHELWYSLFGMYKAPFHGVIAIAVVTALYYAAANGDWPKKQALYIAFVVGLVVIAWALSQKITGGIPWQIPDGRVTGPTGTPVYLGAFLVLLTPIMISSRYRWLALPFLVLALYFTRARGAWISATVAGVAWLMFSGKLKLVRREWLLLALLGTISISGLSHLIFRPVADEMRVELWNVSAAAVKEHPIVGTGPDTFPQTFRRLRTDRFIELRGIKHIQGSAHNDIFQILCTQGYFGLVAYTALLFSVAFLLWDKRKEHPEMVALVAATFLGVWCQAKVNPIPVTVTALLAMMVGCVARDWQPVNSFYDKVKSGMFGGSRRSNYAGYVLAGLLAIVTAFVSVQTMADRAFRVAHNRVRVGDFILADVSFRRAISLWPWNMRYRNFYIQFLGHWLDRLPKREVPRVVQRALNIGIEAVTISPRDPEAWEIYGFALMANGFNEQAAQALFKAQQLDPKFLPVMEARMKIAARMGNRKMYNSIGFRYLRILDLMGVDKRKEVESESSFHLVE